MKIGLKKSLRIDTCTLGRFVAKKYNNIKTAPLLIYYKNNPRLLIIPLLCYNK